MVARSKLLAAGTTAVGPAKPHGGVRVWRGRAPAGAPATSPRPRDGAVDGRRHPSSRYGGSVEPNPSRQEYSDSERQPADRVCNVDAPASGGAADALERPHGRRRTLAVFGAVLLAICMAG